MNVNPPPVPFSVAGPMERQQQPTSLFPQSNVDNIADAPDRGALIPFERPSIRTSILPLPSSIDTPINTSSNIPLDYMTDAPDRGLLLLTNEPYAFRDIYPQEQQLVVQSPYMESISSGFGSSRGEFGRQVARAMVLSREIGSDVPTELLLQGRYNLPGQPTRRRPTKKQRLRISAATTGYKKGV